MTIYKSYNSTVTDITSSVSEIELKGTSLIFNPNTGLYDQLHIIWARQIDTTADFSNLGLLDYSYTRIAVPSDKKELMRGDEMISSTFYSYDVQDITNYYSRRYQNFFKDLPESDMLDLYLNVETNPDIPQHDSIKARSAPYTKEEMKNLPSSYIPGTKISTIVMENEYDSFKTVHNSTHTDYPIVNRIRFTYPKIEPSQSPTTLLLNGNIFENLMLMIGKHADSLNLGTEHYEEDESSSINTVKVFNLQGIIDEYHFVDPYPDPSSTETVVLSHNFYHSPTTPFEVSIHKNTLNQFKLALSNLHTRTFGEIYNKRSCHNEYLFFKIEKWNGSEPLNQPIKTFLVPATNGLVDIIDSQVKQNNLYTYVVKGYSIIVGSNYKFTNRSEVLNAPQFDQYGNPIIVPEAIQYHVISSPTFFIKETVLFEKTVRPNHPVPMRPNVSFHNNSNSKNEIKIFLSLKEGANYEYFTGIEDNDSQQFNGVETLNDKYLFQYNNEPARFEIFRTMEMPKSYNDFAGNRLAEFTNTNSAENMMVLDYIKPNEKYYYTFRAVNESGLVSNPTATYEVELLKDSDESKVVVNTVDFENLKPPSRQPSINFRNLLQIVPSGEQVDINTIPYLVSSGQVETESEFDGFVSEEAGTAETFSQTANLIEIGTAEHKIWGRKFKLRVKSNDTGKVIDFNIKFNLIKNKSEADF